MIFIEDRLENEIIEKLSKGSILSPDLISQVSKEKKVTNQGVYKALSFLLDNEIVTKSKKLISLNTLWIERLKNFTDSVSETYSIDDFNDFLLLDDKERLTYHFKNTTKLDIHWMHVVLLMLKRFKDLPFVIYNPHCWFMMERPNSESAFFEWINKNKRPMFFLIGGNTKLDKTVKKQLGTEYVKIELDTESRFPKDKYIAVIGGYIIYSSYGANFNKKIDTFFNSHTELDQSTTDGFKNALQKDIEPKIIIERNKAKAAKLAKQITKNHYVSTEIKEKMFT